MSTQNSGYTGSQDPNGGSDAAGAHDTKRDALKLKADGAGQQVSAVLRGTLDDVQAHLDDVAARIAHAEGDERNELLARQAQLRAELDKARMDLRSLNAAVESQIADEALRSAE